MCTTLDVYSVQSFMYFMYLLLLFFPVSLSLILLNQRKEGDFAISVPYHSLLVALFYPKFCILAFLCTSLAVHCEKKKGHVAELKEKLSYLNRALSLTWHHFAGTPF